MFRHSQIAKKKSILMESNVLLRVGRTRCGWGQEKCNLEKVLGTRSKVIIRESMSKECKMIAKQSMSRKLKRFESTKSQRDWNRKKKAFSKKAKLYLIWWENICASWSFYKGSLTFARCFMYKTVLFDKKTRQKCFRWCLCNKKIW